MGSLCRLIFSDRRRIVLFLFSISSVIALTAANFIEIFFLGWITNQGFSSVSSSRLSSSSPFVAWIDRLGMTLKELAQQFFIREEAIALLLLFLCIGLFKALSSFAHTYITSLMTIHTSRSLRQHYFSHLQHFSFDFYHRHDVGSLSSRITNDTVKMADAIQALLLNYLQLPCILLGTLTICFTLSIKLSLLSFIVLPLLLLPILFFAKKIKTIAKDLQIHQEKVSSLLVNFFLGIQTIKLFTMEAFALKKYVQANKEMARLEEKNARYASSTRPVIHFFATLLIFSILVYALYFAKMGLSELLIFCCGLHQSYEPLKKFSEVNTVIQQGVAATDRMQEMISQPPTIRDHPKATQWTHFNHAIQFHRVGFYYHSQQWVVRNLSFTIEKGSTVAVVGATGCGKSTLIQLLVRLFDPQEGTIFIDDTPLPMVTQTSVKERIAFVPQHVFLFSDTVANNITIGRSYSLSAIQKAAKEAFADEFIQKMPQKYDSYLQEQGKNLSGGQKQRLAIARALVKRAPILVMDEATSSLDGQSEQSIRSALTALHGKITQIIVTHRLSTISHADKILFLQPNGTIEEGTKDQLLRSSSSFDAFWSAGHCSTPSPCLL